MAHRGSHILSNLTLYRCAIGAKRIVPKGLDFSITEDEVPGKTIQGSCV